MSGHIVGSPSHDISNARFTSPILDFYILVGGIPTPLKKYLSVDSWDYYSQYLEKQKMFQTTNQNHCVLNNNLDMCN
jgi:hypothetical protein